MVKNLDKFHDYSQFIFDATHGNLLAYTFIEPAYDVSAWSDPSV